MDRLTPRLVIHFHAGPSSLLHSSRSLFLPRAGHSHLGALALDSGPSQHLPSPHFSPAAPPLSLGPCTTIPSYNTFCGRAASHLRLGSVSLPGYSSAHPPSGSPPGPPRGAPTSGSGTFFMMPVFLLLKVV